MILFLSGDWLWLEGWLFNIWFLSISFATIIYLYRKDPALLAERYRKPGSGDQPGWDKYVVYGLVIGFFLWIVLMPLDAKRYEWSPAIAWWLKAAGGLLLLISFFFFFRSFVDNTFLTPLVRVQTERKQEVVSTGVYGIVRHPMYFGASLLFAGTPLLLGSLLGLAMGMLLIFLLMARIAGEERMMIRNLEGYEAYIKKVRYRLVPFVW